MSEPHYPERSKARTALTLGIVGLVLPVVAPFAWICGAQELRAQRTERRDPRNFGPAQAGMVMGIVGTVLWTIVLAASGAAVVATLFVTYQDSPNPPEVRNESSQTLTLYWVVGEGGGSPQGTERELTTLRPGNRYSERGDCINGDLVLRTKDGDEFVRRSGPLCRDDGPWIITDEGG